MVWHSAKYCGIVLKGWLILAIFYTFLTSWEKRALFKSKLTIKPKFIWIKKKKVITKSHSYILRLIRWATCNRNFSGLSDRLGNTGKAPNVAIEVAWWPLYLKRTNFWILIFKKWIGLFGPQIKNNGWFHSAKKKRNNLIISDRK